jgi:hypothetical protein
MSRFTSLRQDAIFSSDVFDDTIAAGATLETASVTGEDDLNGLRSQVKRITGESDWFSALSGRDVATLSTSQVAIEDRIFVCDATVLTDITVPAAQNHVILDVSSSEAPTQVAAVAATTEGAIVAQSALNGAGFDVPELIVVAGPNALSPLNLLIVRNAGDKQIPQSSGRDIFGLLQYESTGADGAAFNDISAGARVKISFVRYNAGGTALEAVPSGDIATLDIEYNYNFNRQYKNLDRNCFISTRGFVDQSASVDVTLDNAIDNQSGVVTQAQNIDVQIAAGQRWRYQDATNALLFEVFEGSGGGTSAVNLGAGVDEFDVDAIDVDFAQGIKVGTSKTRPIEIGDTDGVIETTAGDLGLTAFAEMVFVDGNKSGSTFAGAFKLSETSTEWSDFETEFGEVSILNALIQANQSVAPVTKTSVVVTADISADVDAGGVAGGANLSAQIHDLSGGNFVSDHDVYVNGQILTGGANAAANFDYYPGTSLANGQIKFEFSLRGTPANKRDKIMVISRA